MSAPLGALFGRGAAGLPPAEPVDFASLVLPPSPNTCLAAPPGGHPAAHVTVPPLPVDAGTAWALLRGFGARFPRTTPIGEWPDRRQAQWVERSALANFPDIIAAGIARRARRGRAVPLFPQPVRLVRFRREPPPG